MSDEVARCRARRLAARRHCARAPGTCEFLGQELPPSAVEEVNIAGVRSFPQAMTGIWPTDRVEHNPAELQQRTLVALRTLSERSVPGIFAYVAMCSAYAVAIRGDAGSLRTALVAIGVFLVVGTLRLTFHLRGTGLMMRRPTCWRWIFGSFGVGSIVLWDAFTLVELLHRSVDGVSCMLVVVSAMLRASATQSLAPDRRVLRIYATVSRGPLLIALLVVGGAVAHLMVFLSVLDATYGVMLGTRVNAEFWKSVAINEVLREQRHSLEVANAALKAEIDARERVEIELRLAQKLEAVGRLAAGIAHEINTPLQSVMGNVHYASDGVRDLFQLVDAYRAEYQESERDAAIAGVAGRLAAAEHTADLPYLVDNLPQALIMALDGLGRAATIVRSIKEFAHPDDASMMPIDLNRALETTLAIARHEYVAIAEIETDFADLPPVVCHGGELNQVFLNLIVNAAHAIESARHPGDDKGRITVRTRRASEYAEVTVTDTGTGIAPEIRDRVFDPFFTTKQIGQGTGQGLAVARSVIVKRHGGEITFDTEVGRGTTFCVRIPLHGTPRAASDPLATSGIVGAAAPPAAAPMFRA